MSGTTGFVEFRLSRAVEAELLVLEHVSPQVSHDAGSSAIKDFQIWVSTLLQSLFTPTQR